MTDLETKAFELLKKNRVEGEGFAYTRPGGRYHHQFFWDSCFHAIVLRHFDLDFAKRELLSLFRFQDDTGFVPHISFHRTPWLALPIWGRWGSSGLIQPPIVAEAAWSVFEVDHDEFFLQKIYPHLASYYRFLLTVRDHDNDGLFSYIHPWESGWDQSIEWDFAFRTHLALKKQWRLSLWWMTVPFRLARWDQETIVKKARFNVETVDGNTLLALSLGRLGKMATFLGKKEEATEWEKLARRVEEAVIETLWDGKMFVDHYLIGGQHHTIWKRTPVMFYPLLLASLKKEQKQKLLELLVKEFLTVRWPLPTAAPSESHFNAVAYWRGTTWINVNYYVIRGLREQGEKELADTLLRRTKELIEKSGFREYYNPLTGTGLGEKDFSWSTLVVDLLARSED